MLLEQINQPSDLKRLTKEELPVLAEEIRQFLIEKLAVTGGHLASNLGVVELTLVLHYLYDSPRDKMIFDVGHQAYVHKILTGRKDRFDSLRQYKGLCGFVKRAESEHDVWEAGHSSTSLSAAMGMALSRDFKGESNKVIAVIGDGALTGGMALEALNHIGHEKKNLMVVLNDNEMSIAPNVGALHNYLCKIRSDRNYLKAKEEVEQLLKKIPAIGGKLAKTAERVKDGFKYLVVSGMLFEEFGLKYFGPVDGHDIDKLIDIFQQASRVNGPVLIHVVTRKGKGYTPAEADSHKWHGISPYKIESGQVLKALGNPMYTEVFGKTLVELAEQDDRVVAVTPAMPGGSGLLGFAERFPSRMIDVGIAEQHAATMCAALAMEGMKPVFAVYSTFLQRAYDQVVHDICRQSANVIFAIDRAGFVGPDGETHQGVYDIAFMRHIPNIVLMMPKDENELRHMLKTALEYDEGPIAVRYPRVNGVGVELDADLIPIPIGTWEMVRPGDHAAVVAIGPMVQVAEEAAEQLRREGIQLRVINARFMKPLDEAMLTLLAREQLPMIVLEEGSVAGGLGSAIMEYYAQHHVFGVKVKPIGVPDCFVEHGSIKEQRQETGLTVEQLVKEVHTMLFAHGDNRMSRA
ncbi:1-deoxy-D-xylulose-5-phosphate synthase [Paenibacillus thiaminolyticus]|uniref:1-deoxy-D-xylulose-5-phosphate synthase n=3 Tax=Paenibacillus thiaminolyticus TaxID=49283 RepID=A0AAP9DSX7_PANTH|nr:1-deoxy-D-xylulose-5-phosphate synthase [Paenibacillus thiaminolyticus]MCY9536326.1 1-deoxy-D-xylulose-5-phosphate synthase [Paenibacillus thiaminolyticus]MCY9601338.1 1-deoxy-D-xylulose-5-phosphate synthase [Paenibacillus thiaminolyticus]MCY9609340.1 1-deoxy-D-xylulose-5-phosphate synthase [Paenibacillus thiaminolyticus]MCY9612993.1 1-deoxy-D-xylulose-5-phosphate synthase [Paenibacillus thiaminolyticus]MCY9617023.1 1-deoxy-D-xylulose-5-phosphate synthase [Paenibacillus thiaminolyticus]